MPRIWLDGAPAEPSLLGTNDGLNYGRFFTSERDIHRYELSVTVEELTDAFSLSFEALVAEMRVDDLLDEEPSALQRMGYPTLREAFHHPSELEEVIDIFMDRDILVRFVPPTEQSRYVIHSTDRIHVSPTGVAIHGRCFRAPVDEATPSPSASTSP